MPSSTPKIHGQDARATKIAPFRLAVFLVVVAGAMAGDKPSAPDGYAPPETFSPEQREHWAYQPVKRAVPPAVKESGWVRNPIDRFILAEIEKLGMVHAPEADRVPLIRRVTFDLTGLPPSPDEVAVLRWRSAPGRLRTPGRSAACQPAVWRAVGPALARPGSLRRFQRLRARRRTPRRLALSRLGRERSERRSALRSVLDAANRRR